MRPEAWAIVVARTGPRAKTRLAPALDHEARSALALAMLRDVLQAVARAGLAGTVAVLDPPRAPMAGPLILPDPGQGLVGAVQAGLDASMARGAGLVVALPGDIPLLSPDDVLALLEAAAAPRSVVIAPDRRGRGTNALVLRPPGVIPPAFGPHSAARHAEAASALGVPAERMDLERVALDVDTPEDLAELLRRGPHGATAIELGQLMRAGAVRLPGAMPT